MPLVASGQDDSGSQGERKKKQRGKKRARTSITSRSKRDEETKEGKSPDQDDMEGTTGTGAAGRLCVKVVVDDLPDKAMHHVVDFLGMPESGGERYPRSFSYYYLSDLTWMAQVFHRWKKVVRSNGVWKVICEQRWSWLQPGDMERLELVSDDPRHRVVKDGEASKWMELCSHVGRYLGWGGAFPYDIGMVVDVDNNSRRLLSERGHVFSQILVGAGLQERGWSLQTAPGPEDYRVHFWPLQDVLGMRSSDPVAIAQGLREWWIDIQLILIDASTNRKAKLSFYIFRATGVCHQVSPQESYIEGPDEQKLMFSTEGLPLLFQASDPCETRGGTGFW